MNAATFTTDKTSVRCLRLRGVASGNSTLAAQKSVSWSDEACVHRISFDPDQARREAAEEHDQPAFRTLEFRSAGPAIRGRAEKPSPDSIWASSISNAARRSRRWREFELSGAQRHRRLSAGQDRRDRRRMPVRQCRDPRPCAIRLALREYTRASSCTHFIDALEGKTDIMKVFRENGRPAV